MPLQRNAHDYPRVPEGVGDTRDGGPRGEAPSPTEPPAIVLRESQPAMNGNVLRRKVTVTDPLGLHMRPLTAFAQRAIQFQSSVTVSKDNQRVNGKSPLELMLLAAEQGTELELEVSGADAEVALETLAQFLGSPGLDEERGATG
jgi:phosphocarrier protein HPr